MTNDTLNSAQEAVSLGDWEGAAKQLRRAANEAAARGEAQRAAHCEQMAASLYRAAGSLEESLAAAARVAGRANESPRARFAAEAERAETLFAAGKFADACQAWEKAIHEADRLNLPDTPRATVVRRHALCLAHAGQREEAWANFDAAASLMADSGIEHAVAWVDIEHAQVACDIREVPEARRVLARDRVVRAAGEDDHLRAQMHCVRAACALVDRDAVAARDEARAAREAALLAVAPIAYFAASVYLSQAADLLGDRVEAYRALATAWVTLSDLLGEPVARSWVEPVLLAFQWQWGEEAFATVRAEHDRQRRIDLGNKA